MVMGHVHGREPCYAKKGEARRAICLGAFGQRRMPRGRLAECLQMAPMAEAASWHLESYGEPTIWPAALPAWPNARLTGGPPAVDGPGGPPVTPCPPRTASAR